MNENIDLIRIIGNLSQSIQSLNHLGAGLSYLLGIIFVLIAITKFKDLSHSSSREKSFVAFAYLLGGMLLIFLPTSIKLFSNTAFGTSNPLQYTAVNRGDIYTSMAAVVQFAGLIWFIRGSILLIHASEPGVQHGPKGLAFLAAGILAMNFERSIGFVNYLFDQLFHLNIHT
jgi:hypothetical protein